MEPILPLISFTKLPEDVQIYIISFLDQSELAAFASTSNNYFGLCHDDDQLWFVKCSRRWGSVTQIHKWGGRGKISYRNLYRLLSQHEKLIGYWHYNYYPRNRPSPSPQLVLFEWDSFYITGYSISPSKYRGYGVTKKPFMWITAASDGQALNYLDINGTLCLTEKDLFSEDSEKLRSSGLTLVDIYLESSGLSLRENRQYLAFRKLRDTVSGGEECEFVYRSSPEALLKEILKVSSPSSSKKQGRRWRQGGVCRWRSLRLLRTANPPPSPTRPLEGLWKGIGPNGSLNFYSVSYHVNKYVDMSFGHVVGSPRHRIFTASTTAFAVSPEEQEIYESRSHLQSTTFEDADLDVLSIFYANSPDRNYGDGYFENADGRLWVYADGTFGFGYLRDNYIVDLKPMTKNGLLLDAIYDTSP